MHNLSGSLTGLWDARYDRRLLPAVRADAEPDSAVAEFGRSWSFPTAKDKGSGANF